jgi:hypothetical protein
LRVECCNVCKLSFLCSIIFITNILHTTISKCGFN